MQDYIIKITLKEFDFLRAYIDIESETFANAYQSALKAGYSKNYARVIRRHYSTYRLKMLKNALKNDDLVKMIEATRDLPFGDPYMDDEEFERQMRKMDRELYGMTANQIIAAHKKLFGKSE